MTVSNVRGAGRPRGGATDTTMLIWKVIEANPGITRAGIWQRVEHGIPEGYAIRMYGHYLANRRLSPASPQDNLARARNYVLTDKLNKMRQSGLVSTDESSGERQYIVAREPTYLGNPEAIDVTGTKAADHMALADALRTLERMRAKVDPGRPIQLWPKVTRKEYEALAVVIKALRAH